MQFTKGIEHVQKEIYKAPIPADVPGIGLSPATYLCQD